MNYDGFGKNNIQSLKSQFNIHFWIGDEEEFNSFIIIIVDSLLEEKNNSHLIDWMYRLEMNIVLLLGRK